MSHSRGSPSTSCGTHFHLLLGLGWRRIGKLLRYPSLPLAVGTLLPLGVVVTALWTLGRLGAPSAEGAEGGVTLGLLVSGLISFLAYGLLFRGRDDSFLRRLGIDFRALFLERALRLAASGLAISALLGVPFLAAGEPAARPLVIGGSSALLAVGTAALAFAAAAHATANPGGSSWSSIGIRQWDPGLARAAPLVYAPLIPFLAGAAAGGFAGAAPGAAIGRLLIVAALAAAGVAGGALIYERAAPRFLPQAGEMAFNPPPRGTGEEFRVGKGISWLLPRRSAAVWVRDAAVAGRRFTWASRITWPVAIVSITALARSGDAPAIRIWVLAAVGIALLVQAAAVVGLGRLERRGPRWLDRSGGLRWPERWLGRWAWAWGLSLWLLLPVALAWHWWSGLPGAWAWPIVGAASAAIAAGASLLNSERA